MKKYIFFLVLIALAASASAQYSQSRPTHQFMTKLEFGYLPFVANVGDATKEPTANNQAKYPLDSMEHAAGFNFMMGSNISQDFFIGGGLGYAYCAPIKSLGSGRHSAIFFADFDYRPLAEKFAPLLGARLGGSFLTGNDTHESSLSPYLEVYAGLNIYTNHVISNMERNNKSFYIELGAAYMQRTVFLPIRFGWRW